MRERNHVVIVDVGPSAFFAAFTLAGAGMEVISIFERRKDKGRELFK